MKLREQIQNAVVNQLRTGEDKSIWIEAISDVVSIGFALWIKNSSIKDTDLPMNILLKMYKDRHGL